MPTRHLELWQAEWCPASHRVRKRLTELGLTYTVHQVPVAPEARDALVAATAARTIPVLVVGVTAVVGEAAIRDYLDEHYVEPPEALAQREKAAKVKQRELERTCRELTTAHTP